MGISDEFIFVKHSNLLLEYQICEGHLASAVALPGRDCDTRQGWSISKGEEERAFSKLLTVQFKPEVTEYS